MTPIRAYKHLLFALVLIAAKIPIAQAMAHAKELDDDVVLLLSAMDPMSLEVEVSSQSESLHKALARLKRAKDLLSTFTQIIQEPETTDDTFAREKKLRYCSEQESASTLMKRTYGEELLARHGLFQAKALLLEKQIEQAQLERTKQGLLRVECSEEGPAIIIERSALSESSGPEAKSCWCLLC